MKKMLIICAVLIFTAGSVEAQTTYNYGTGLAPFVGAIGSDAKAFIGNGSWKNNQSVPYVEFMLDLSEFGTFTIDEIDYIKYATNKAGLENEVDFFVKIYTVPYPGGSSSWYGNRLNAEPYYSNNLNAPSNSWNEWNTSSANNELTFFDQPVTSMYGWYGGQPTLSDLQAGVIDWSSYNSSAPSTTIDYGAQEVMRIDIGTGSDWNNTLSGFLDQIIVSVNSTIVTWNLEGGLSEVWVDDDWAGSSIVDPVDGHIFGNDAFATIQDGIDAVIGSTVNVAAGIYNEHVIIDKSLTLQGAGANQTTIDVSGLPIINPHIAVKIQNGVNNVVVDGFEIIGVPTLHHSDDSVIRCGSGGGTNSNITISNNILNGYMGILFKSGDGLTIQQNDITFNKNAIVIQGGCTNIDISDNTMTGGTSINTDPAGIYITSTTGSITGNTIQNVIGSTDDRGKGITGSSNHDLLIDDNIINNTGYDGISFWSNTHHVTISNNTLSNNAQTYTKGAGISIKGDDITIINNNITGSGYDGITIDTHTLESVHIAINYNNISGNTDYGLNVKNAGETVDASCNWWGAADGPSGSGSGSGDAISGDITYLPWLVTSDLDGSCIGGTLLGIKSGVRDDLATLLSSGSDDKKTDKILEKAIKHLKKSLADELWEDNDHLSSKGIKVFEEEKTAVHELMKINDLDVNTSILALVEADRMLAQIAINETVNDKDEAKAEGEMTKALDEFNKGNFDKAIEHYKQAWHQATKALKNLSKSFANSDGAEGSELVDSAIPEVFGLRENYPNPFNPTTLISYDLPEASQVTMTVYDMMGRQVKSLVQEFQPAGNHSVIWNATNDNGTKMSGGIYFYQIKAGSFQKTHKMILLK